MKKLLISCVIFLGLHTLALASSSGPSLPADEAMQMLKDGNARYVASQPTHSHQGAERRAETVKDGQHPIATIIGCSDSRAPLEVLFDQGVGDIFVIRVAGNIAGASEPAASATAPAALGAAAWPRPKKRVTNPKPAGANRGPSKSPQIAAIMAGMLQADRPNRAAERVSPAGEGRSANRPKATV